MTPIKRPNSRRPQYFRGQLLDELDFRAEQDYHRMAMLRHHLRFHSWGVAQGLSVSRHSDTEVSVSPGLAIDSLGREVFLDETAILGISNFAPNQTVFVTLSFEESADQPRKTEYGEGHSGMTEYSVLSASTTAGEKASVTLASVRLDANAKVVADSISYAQTNYATSILSPRAVTNRELADGSITQSKLGPGLHTGWVRMACKPHPLEDKKPFRIGPTEARSTDEGAAGSMSIPVPPGVSTVKRFRVAGELNNGVIKVALYCCGWDEEEKDHEKTPLLEKDLPKGTPDRGFEHTVPVDEKLWKLDPQYHALSVVIEVTKKLRSPWSQSNLDTKLFT